MTTSIGYRWKCSNAWSRVVLIARKLLECRKRSFKRALQFMVSLPSLSLRNAGGYSERAHLFPFRTEKLSLSALMVLPERVGE